MPSIENPMEKLPEGEMMSVYASDIAMENEVDLKKLRTSLLRKIPNEMKEIDRLQTVGLDTSYANRSFEEILNENSFDMYARNRLSVGDRTASTSFNNRSVYLNLKHDLYSNKPQTRGSEGCGIDLLQRPMKPLKTKRGSMKNFRRTQVAFAKKSLLEQQEKA